MVKEKAIGTGSLSVLMASSGDCRLRVVQTGGLGRGVWLHVEDSVRLAWKLCRGQVTAGHGARGTSRGGSQR